ncbi:MAG: hypothetical protein OES46_16900 [Gammaproteobacteria bacterium]|nr:hypothetical protein [Gammaproteobacteria bacterium]
MLSILGTDVMHVPLHLSNESLATMRRIEQMVFVVEAGRTPQYLVTAIATLDSSKSINLVLKKRRKSFAGSSMVTTATEDTDMG